MSRRFFRLPSSRFHRLLLAALGALPLAGAGCSGDEGDDEAPAADYAVVVTSLNGTASDEPIALRCDGTLAIQVAISTSDPSVPFVLRPAYACGTSTRCGYVHLEALDANDEVLASVDTATLAGVLALPSADSVPARIRAVLLSGVDREPLENPSGDEPSAIVEPTFELPATTCEVPGAGGEGGAASGGAPQGGAPSGGAPQGGAPSGGAPQGGVPSGGGEGLGEGGSMPSAGASGSSPQGGTGTGGTL